MPLDQIDDQNLDDSAAGDDSFDTAFAEFAGEESADTSGASESLEDTDAAAQQLRDEQGRFASAEDDAGSTEDATGQPNAAPASIDWDGNDNPWKHKYQSDLGRQNALQHQIAELKQQNQQLQGHQKNDPQQDTGENPQGSGMSDAQWDALKEEFPEIASAFESRMAAVEQNYQGQIQKQSQMMEQLQNQFQPIQQQAVQQHKAAQVENLKTQHADFADYFVPPGVPLDQLPEKAQKFKSWLGQQPGNVQQMVHSNDAADAAWLLSSFKQAAQPDTSDLRAKRKQQLQTAQTTPRRGAAAVQDSGDFDALFNEFANKKSA